MLGLSVSISIVCVPVLDSHSVLEVESDRKWPQSLPQDAGMVALLEHVQVHSLLVLEPDPLGLLVSVEGVHQHQRDVAAVLLVQELGGRERGRGGSFTQFVLHSSAFYEV